MEGREMKTHAEGDLNIRGLLWPALVACATLCACSTTPRVVSDLPELPAQYASDLTFAHSAPVLMTRPLVVSTVQPSLPGTTLPLIARACTAIYDGYVLYPMTVCYPPTDVFGSLDPPLALAAHTSSRVPSVPDRYFKLSAHPLIRFGPWFCTVRAGPWYAHVEGAQGCNTNPNISQFRADILSAPEAVVVIWSGALTDVPPPLNLFGITQTGDSCTCCSGTMCPNGSCVLNPQQCGSMQPAR
jgi:hypothetical protein